MKTFQLLAASVVLSLFSVAANADNKTGGYMHGTLGFSNLKSADVDAWQDLAEILTGTSSGSGVDAGFGAIFGGGYRFNQYFALEGGFAVGGGSFDILDESFDAQNFTLYGAGVGFLPINENFEVFGKLGFGSTRTTITWTDSFDGQNYEDKSSNKMSMVYGVGAGYTPTGSNVTWLIEYMHTSKESTSNTAATSVFGSSIFGIGGRVKF